MKLKAKLQGYVNSFSDTVENFTKKHTARFFKSPEKANKFAKTTGVIVAGISSVTAMGTIMAVGAGIAGTVGGYAVVTAAPSLLSVAAHISVIGSAILTVSGAYMGGKMALSCADEKLPRSEKGVRNSVKSTFKSIKKNAVQKPALFATISIVGLAGSYALDTAFSAPGNSNVDKFNSAVEQQKATLSKMTGVKDTPSSLRRSRTR